jgi:hypothetical protein
MSAEFNHKLGLILSLQALLLAPALASAATFTIGDGFSQDVGVVWSKVSYISWRADERFAGTSERDLTRGVELGERVPFDRALGGQLRTRSLYVNLLVAPVEDLEIGVDFAPYQYLRFENDNTVSTSAGTGDIWSHAAYELLSTNNAATKLGLQFKIPTTSIPRDEFTVPLSEGQYDLAVEHATTYMPVDKLHLTVQTALRHRFPGDDNGAKFKPGNEAQFGFKVGGAPISRVWLKGGYETLWASGWESRGGRGAVSTEDKRILHEINGAAYVKVGDLMTPALSGLALDAWLEYPVAGQNLPAGLKWSVGLAWQESLW